MVEDQPPIGVHPVEHEWCELGEFQESAWEIECKPGRSADARRARQRTVWRRISPGAPLPACPPAPPPARARSSAAPPAFRHWCAARLRSVGQGQPADTRGCAPVQTSTNTNDDACVALQSILKSTQATAGT
jgi:hypothetical protein